MSDTAIPTAELAPAEPITLTPAFLRLLCWLALRPHGCTTQEAARCLAIAREHASDGFSALARVGLVERGELPREKGERNAVATWTITDAGRARLDWEAGEAERKAEAARKRVDQLERRGERYARAIQKRARKLSEDEWTETDWRRQERYFGGAEVVEVDGGRVHRAVMDGRAG